MSDTHDPDAQAREAGEKSERLLQDTYLSGAVGMGAAGPRLSAGMLGSAQDSDAEILVHEDHSWKSHAEEEGGAGDEPGCGGGGLRGLVGRLFRR